MNDVTAIADIFDESEKWSDEEISHCPPLFVALRKRYLAIKHDDVVSTREGTENGNTTNSRA